LATVEGISEVVEISSKLAIEAAKAFLELEKC
jgi:hypothetical protein